MDIRAWEGRASALEEKTHGAELGFGEDEDYFDEAEYEEMLFRRVLDKIRISRAAGNADVQLSPEELDAYQSKMYGTRTSAARPQPQSRPTSAPTANDAVSVLSVEAPSKHGSSSRSKKSQHRSSIFASKPKKEKHSHRKRIETSSTAEVHAPPPGFVVPGPDGQPVYAPINSYQGNLTREPEPFRSASRSASDSSHQLPTPTRITPPRDMLGAFPSSEYDYMSSSPPRQGRSISSRQAAYERDLASAPRARSPSIASSKLVPIAVEPYQYHAFSPPSSSSPTSPQPQYTRRVSSGPSEASYTSMPRRVPVPTPGLQRTVASHASTSDPALATQTSSSSAHPVQSVETARASGSSHHHGEKKRKSGKSRKKV